MASIQNAKTLIASITNNWSRRDVLGDEGGSRTMFLLARLVTLIDHCDHMYSIGATEYEEYSKILKAKLALLKRECCDYVKSGDRLVTSVTHTTFYNPISIGNTVPDGSGHIQNTDTGTNAQSWTLYEDTQLGEAYLWAGKEELVGFKFTPDDIQRTFDGGVTWEDMGGAETFDSDIIVDISSGFFGKYSNGETVPAQGKTSKEVIIEALSELKQYIYKAPTSTLFISHTIAEVGTEVTPTLTARFIQNDAGPSTKAEFLHNNVLLGENTVMSGNDYIYTVPPVIAEDVTQMYKSIVHYEEGDVVLNNQGDPSPNHILAGTLERLSGLSGRRYTFYGAGTGFDATTSDGIRALTGKSLGLGNGAVILVEIPAGSDEVLFAYPSNLGLIDSVEHVEASDARVEGIFTHSHVNVAGVNGHDPLQYNVYYYKADAAFSQLATFRFTI